MSHKRLKRDGKPMRALLVLRTEPNVGATRWKITQEGLDLLTSEGLR